MYVEVKLNHKLNSRAQTQSSRVTLGETLHVGFWPALQSVCFRHIGKSTLTPTIVSRVCSCFQNMESCAIDFVETWKFGPRWL